MVGVNNLVWDAFAEFMYLRYKFLCNALPVSAFLDLLELRRK